MKRERRSKALVRQGAPQPPDAIGETALAVRDEILGLTGWSRERQAVAVAHSLAVLTDELGALATERVVVRDGQYTERIETFDDIDHKARQAAADKLLTVFGMYPSKNAGGSGPAAIQINISLRSMDDGPGEVIEADVVQVPAK
jgi:hypothetical protein